MRERLAFGLLLTALAWGQPAFDDGPKAMNIGHASARIVWTATSAPTDAEIEWGLTAGYGSTRFANIGSDGAPYTITAALVSLTPNTTYHVRGRMNSGSVLSGDVTFTTLVEPFPHPAEPIAPSEPDITMPTITGSTHNVDATCSNISTILTTLAGLAGSLNDEVVIPAGTTCWDRVTWPARPAHTGWVVVRSSAVGTDAFPPEGVRWTPNWSTANTLANFTTRKVGISGSAAQTALSSAACSSSLYYEGGLVQVTGLPTSLFRLLRCSDSYSAYSGNVAISAMSGSLPVTITVPGHTLEEGMIVYIPVGNGYVTAGTYYVYDPSGDTFSIYVSGSGSYAGGLDIEVRNQYRLPTVTKSAADPVGACTEEYWHYNTATQKQWWCVQGAWVEFSIPASFSSDEEHAIRVDGSKYRFVGLQVTAQQVPGAPSSYPAGWGTYSGLYGTNRQGMIYELVDVDGSDVIFDRSYVHGLDKPGRVRKGFDVTGDRFALINSHVSNFHEWRYHATGVDADYSQITSGYAVFHLSGSGSFLQNNFLEAAGITYFGESPCTTGHCPVTDIVLRRNTNSKRPEWRRTATQLWQYPNRHPFEIKHGRRVLLEGNQFTYSWAGINAGGYVMLSASMPYSLPAAFTISSWKDGVLSLAGTSYFNQGDLIYISSTDASHNGIHEVASNGCPSACTTTTLVGTFSGSGAGGTADLRAQGPLISDVRIEHNSFYQGTEFMRVGVATGCYSGSSLFCNAPMERLAVRNNLFVDMDVRAHASGGRNDLNNFRGVWPDNGSRHGYATHGHVIDWTMSHNTTYSNQGDIPSLMILEESANETNEGLRLSDNLGYFQTSGWQGFRGGSAQGTATLNETSLRDATPDWVAANNVFCCGLSGYSGSYPATTQWPAAVVDVKWLNPSAAAPYDFRLRHDSPYISGGANRASDDKDVGVDMDALEAAQGLVKHVRARSIGATSAVVSYYAPDTVACTVEYGTSATWGTGTRIADGGGDRARNVTLTPLSSGTLYHYRVLCAVEQPAGSFLTL